MNNLSPNLIDSTSYAYNSDSKKGVYIIHGFTNSTYETKEFAQYMGKKGFYAVADNLPGHGTSVEECNRCKYQNWIDFVEQRVAEMSSKCDSIYLVGISMGSVLALHLSTLFPINASIFAATVLKFKDYFGTRVLTPMLHKIVPFRKKKYSYPKEIRDSINFLGYHSWPMSAVNEFRKLTNKVRKDLPLINTPALIMHSNLDKLQHPANTDLVFNSISSKIKEKFFVDAAGHNLFIKSPDQEKIFKKAAAFLNKF